MTKIRFVRRLTNFTGVDNYTAADNTPIEVLRDGNEIAFFAKFEQTNTSSAVTLNLGGMGHIDLRRNGDTPLEGGDLDPTFSYLCVFNGNHLEIVNGIFSSGGTAGVTTYLQNGVNTFTGGTSLLPTVNITSATLNSLAVTGSGVTTIGIVSSTTISANTIISGSTNLYNIFATVPNNEIIHNLTTGLISGGTLTLNADPTKFDVAPAYGIVVDNWTNSSNPIIHYISFSGQSGITTTYLSSSTISHISLTSGGTIFQNPTEESNQYKRENIMIGILNHPYYTAITSTVEQIDTLFSPLSQYRDLMSMFKLVSNGNIISANGTNLKINKSSGFLFGQGINYLSNIKDPHKKTISASTASQFQYATSTGYTNTTTDIDTLNYDLNGMVTAIGGTTRAQNQRVYLMSDGNLKIQYGQTWYSNLTQAIQGLQIETFTINPNINQFGILIGIISVQRNCTDLTNDSRAAFIQVSIFGQNLGGAAGFATTTLQQAYNNSVTPEIVINSALDGITFINGTGNADNITNLVEGANSVSAITSYIRADGSASFSTLSASTYYSGSTNISNLFVSTGATWSTI